MFSFNPLLPFSSNRLIASAASTTAALQVLADEVEADSQKRDVWESGDAKAAFKAKTTEAVETDNAKIAEIEEAERKAAEEAEVARGAQEQAVAQQTYNYNSGRYDSGSNGYSDGYDNGGYGESSGGGSGSSSDGGSGNTWWLGEGDDKFYYYPTKPGWFDELLG